MPCGFLCIIACLFILFYFIKSPNSYVIPVMIGDKNDIKLNKHIALKSRGQECSNGFDTCRLLSFFIIYLSYFFLPLRSLTEKKSQGTSSWNYLTSANFSGFDICFGFVWLKFRYFKRALSVINALRWVKSKSLAFYKIWQFYSMLKNMYNFFFFILDIITVLTIFYTLLSMNIQIKYYRSNSVHK